MPDIENPKSPWPRAILHLDMDAFFVNVYLLEHPEDKGIPIAVGGRPEDRGVVASASYEARQFGVRSAMPTSTAVRLCPQLKLVGHVWPRIRESSRQIMAILGDYGPVEKMSVDEAYVDLSGRPQPEQIAADIRQRVKAETGLPASVGLATSKLVAKIASDHQKPEGYTVVPPGTEAAFLAPLSVRAIHGVGPSTAARLADLGVQTCAQLAAADPVRLHAALGKQGLELKTRAQGIDDRPVEAERGPTKSISQEITFSRDVGDTNVLRAELQTMSQRVAEQLREEKLVAHTITVKFRTTDFTTFTRQKTITVGTDDAAEIYRLALAIWQEHWPAGRKMRLLGVGVSKLEEPAGRQLGLGIGG
jgi:DNA polymerase-4